jgi:hypothetical protein
VTELERFAEEVGVDREDEDEQEEVRA